MNAKFLNELREKLGVGLSEAMRLLKENGEDFEKCEKALYDEKIAQIIAATECQPHEAEASFQRFYDVEKAVKSLKNRASVCSVEGLAYDEPYGFVLSAFDENENELEGKNAVIIVPFSHFEKYLLESFQAVFPIENYIFENDNSFDVTGDNFFGKKEIFEIIEHLKSQKFPHENERIFVQKIIDWLTEKIAIAHEINVFGTL